MCYSQKIWKPDTAFGEEFLWHYLGAGDILITWWCDLTNFPSKNLKDVLLKENWSC